MMPQGLNHHHSRTWEEIFAHPIPHNLEWADVVSLVEHLGSVQERHDGKFEFKIGAVSEVFTRPHDKDLDVEEVVRLRKFLTQATV